MNIIDYILLEFSDKEISVYRGRTFEKKTLEQLAKELGLTRERIRQIEAKMREKIRMLKLDIEIRVKDKYI